MDAVHFLNLEYFLVLVYRIFTGTNVDASQIPTQTLALMTYIAWTGLGLSIIFLGLFIYVKIRTREVEHAGWHNRKKEEEALEKRHDMRTAVNPQWEHVLMLSGGPTESDWRRAIIEADIMLGALLTERGYTGDTIGDKLKGANPLQFTTLDHAWDAHKVRNKIAHEGAGFHLSDRDTHTTIENYRQVFEEFNYL